MKSVTERASASDQEDFASKQYRDRLARIVRDMRARGEKSLARAMHEEETKKDTYVLSRVLKLERGVVPTTQWDMDDPTERGYEWSGVVSNEPSLYELFPYVKDMQGAALGVGFDQMLDMAVNSNLDLIFMVDIAPSTSHATKAVLEVGRRFHVLHGRYPTQQEFIDHFLEERIPLTLEMIRENFSTEELRQIGELFSKRIDDQGRYGADPVNTHPLKIEYYLTFKLMQQDYTSWVSKPETLEKIIRMYEEGRIRPIRANIVGTKTMAEIASLLKKEGLPLSLVYLSNAETHYFGDAEESAWKQILDSMIVNDDTVIIRTGVGEGKNPPFAVLRDKWMSMMSLNWPYEFQTLADLRKQNEGAFTITDENERTIVLSTLMDRKRAVERFEATPEEMGLFVPTSHVVVAGMNHKK